MRHSTPCIWVVIDAKTIGASALAADCYEIAALRIETGQITRRFFSTVRPQRPLPESLRRMSGLSDATLAHAPDWTTVAQHLQDWMGDEQVVLVLQGLAPTRPGGLIRHPWLGTSAHRWLDLDRLAHVCLPDLASTRLRNLLDALGIDWMLTYRAQSDVEALWRVFEALLAKAGPAQTQALCCAQSSRRAPRTGQPRPLMVKRFDPSTLKHYPVSPGVYRMKNPAGTLIYIGKANNLRKRLQWYFGAAAAQNRKTRELVSQIATIDTQRVGSELEALLLEARLIKQHQPYFNRMIKHFHRLCYLGVSVEHDWPGLSVAARADSQENRLLFGPFARHTRLHRVIETLGPYFQLRRCNDATFRRRRNNPCLDYDLGLCSGPCAGKVSPQAYRRQVEDFLAYLHGETPTLKTALISRRDAESQAMAFESAAETQRAITLLDAIQARSLLGIRAVQQTHCLIVLADCLPDHYRLCLVYGGLPFAWLSLHPDDPAHWQELSEQLTRIAGLLEQAGRARALDKALFEEARLINRWLAAHCDPERADGEPGSVIWLKDRTVLSVLSEVKTLLQQAQMSASG